MKFGPAVLVLALVASASPVSAQAANPQPLGAATGDCSGGGFASTYSLPPTAGNHPSTIQMAQVNKAGFWSSPDIELVGADTVWRQGGALQAGIAETGYFMCLNNVPLSYTVTQYDTPTAPTSFAGSVTPGDNINGGYEFGSELGYIAPGAAPYVADVTLARGAVRIGSSYTGATVASSKTIDLGAMNAGEQSLSLTALEGPQAVWTVTIRPLPIQVTGVALALTKARPGQTNSVRYTTNGDTQITAAVIDRAGAQKRTLATAMPVGRGDHNLTWDGTDQNGRALSDGEYSVRLHSVDPVGNQSDAQTGVAIDGTPPKIAWPRSTKIGRKQAIVIRVSDKGVGLRSAVLKHRGRVVAKLRSGSRKIVHRPGRGYHWTPGRARYKVIARDALGNTSKRSRTLRVKR